MVGGGGRRLGFQSLVLEPGAVIVLATYAGSQWPETWPVLTCSQKQVYWAAGIRAKLVGFLHEKLAHDWLDRERCYPIAQWLAGQGVAKFWIEHLGNAWDVIDLLQAYEGRRPVTDW